MTRIRTRACGRLPVVGLAAVLVLWPGGASADMFTGLAALRDTLRSWETKAPAFDSLETEWTLEELFPGARIARTGERLHINLPPLYKGQFAASLWASGSAPAWEFSVDMELQDSLVILDGRLAEGLPADTALADLHQHVRQTLTALRTLGVPWAPRPPAWGTEVEPVTVTLVGRDIAEFSFTAPAWWDCLRRLAQGAMVYAFLQESTVRDGAADLSWAVVLRLPGSTGQHLVHSRERLELGSVRSVLVYEVRLVPGVRLDNVDELLAPAEPAQTLGQRWPVHLGRR